MGSAVITSYDLQDFGSSISRCFNTSEQLTLALLREKGAPVDGTLMLRFRKGYEVTRHEDIMTDSIHFNWREI